MPSGLSLTIGLRPEHLRLAPVKQAMMPMPVGPIESTGAMMCLGSATKPAINVLTAERQGFTPGDVMPLAFDIASLHLFDDKTERRMDL